MFKNIFSFDGRIRRTEYGISIIIFAFATVIIKLIAELDGLFVFIFQLPAIWFLCAQGAKRCHDVGNSGWWQLIPFYGFWLLFQDGAKDKNQYGYNPRKKPALY
jgi:uncharacterized membrane protein YhaH (DUF805 family)